MNFSDSRNPRRFAVTAISLLLLSTIVPGAFALPGGFGHKPWANSPLPNEMQVTLEKAGHYAKSGHYQQAARVVSGVLDSATDVPKCIAIAAYTDNWGTPMMESRRACLNKALSLATSRDDMILVALKSRQYQFFEITRQAVNSLIGNAKTVPELYDLATKAHEVALTDVAHLAMERAYTGINSEKGVFDYTAQCKALGMEDLQRKAMKDLMDDTQDIGHLCDVMLKFSGYDMRDLNRYGLRKALDSAQTIPEMQNIYEVAVRLNEPDVANRANYFVRKGKVIQQIKEDRQSYEAQLRSWREGVDLDTARAQDAARGTDPGFSGGAKTGAPPGSGF